jgi:hypothetical protein
VSNDGPTLARRDRAGQIRQQVSSAEPNDALNVMASRAPRIRCGTRRHAIVTPSSPHARRDAIAIADHRADPERRLLEEYGCRVRSWEFVVP